MGFQARDKLFHMCNSCNVSWQPPAHAHQTNPLDPCWCCPCTQVHGAVGLRTLLSAQHSVQLTPESSASLVASWQPHAGLGLQFVSQRQLSSTINGEYSWVVGPPEAAGMSLGLTRRTDKTLLSGRLEVSGGTGACCSCLERWKQLGCT